ncbi:MAG TPA: hypothetical protein VJX92_22560 [Methylomirabilota bacterium]|nr:hypothetical protein [Methylomirabilota bacterium]
MPDPPSSQMPTRLGIRATILAAFGAVALLLLLYLGLALVNNRRQAETLAAVKAEHVATIIAMTVARHDPALKGALLDDPAALQRYVRELHRIQRRDIEVIDPTNRIVADVAPEDIGHEVEGSLAAAAEGVRRTGAAQRFVEVRGEYPTGIRQIAVPIARDGVRAGSVLVLEYTPLYDGIMAKSAGPNSIEAGVIVVLVGLTLTMGWYISRLVGREARARSESAQLRAVTHLANAAAHEINSSLTTVIGRLDMLADRVPNPSREYELVRKAREATGRIGAMVANMQHITHLEYLAVPGQETLPVALDLEKSAEPQARD